MKIAVFSTKHYDRNFFEKKLAASEDLEMMYLETRLTINTAVLAKGFDVVCAFVNDDLDKTILDVLKGEGVKLVALRCAGFNNVDLKHAEKIGLQVCRVPAYSPYAVAEYTVGMLLALNRQYVRAWNRVRDNNFTLDGLVGFDVHGKTVGVVGTGTIGQIFCRIMQGMGCTVIASDPYPQASLIEAGVRYVDLDELISSSDIISLFCPLLPATHHLINAKRIDQMKNGVTLINTSRGKLIDTEALIQGLKSGRIGRVGLDVYEEEDGLFFEDKSDDILQDDNFARLLTFRNVLVTGHQAFLTEEALENITDVTLNNIRAFRDTGSATHRVCLEGK
jgi:D-lactate dehydrogenase